ncbi:hypothetical protein Tsubulata_039945 [Turnera subulata]|uniref:Exocyst subunit Exo70 family protein n=1 Tax=Turnera subulata TaxID=218843 RepID=A0A9Q0FV16_9ROSI|nr:hypothetical protein Tsubulata_016535 [Turnera subulata]KAJ4838121.1 hypothetical protein Tsubulata_039945 [Turnera subulata]
MRSIFFKASSPSSTPPPATQPRHTFSDTLMDENIENARSLIFKWDASDPSTYCNTTSLFSSDNRAEAKEYLNAITALQSAMQHYISGDSSSSSEKLIFAQHLMQIAMKRLEKEFYQILKSNRQYLDPESVSTSSVRSRSSVTSLSSSAVTSDAEDDQSDDESPSREVESVSEVERASILAMDDLKAIADCMIGAGYAKECVKIYKIIRKSIVDEALYHLGIERLLTSSQIQKMDWEVLEIKVKSWLNAIKVSVKTLFYGERVLCDYVFASSPSIRESCFTEITQEGALSLFLFAENVAKTKRIPEKLFKVLDLYEAISDLWPEIETIFSFESTSSVKTQAINSLVKLGDAVRGILIEFESAIQKDNSRTPVPGGGIHPLTRYVMNYISFLCDYNGILVDILADWPLPVPSRLPESYFDSPPVSAEEDELTSALAARLAWLVLVLLCKLDGKAELYKDVALSYLFLANNLQYVVNKAKKSNMKFLLGEDWIAKHEAKVRQYAANYERMGWSKVFEALPVNNNRAEMTASQVADVFKRFNSAFEEAYKRQSSWVVQDTKLREDIKVSVAKKVGPVYGEFYRRFRAVVAGREGVVRFAPDDLGNYMSDLLHGTGGPGSVSSTHSSTSSASGHTRRGGRSR